MNTVFRIRALLMGLVVLACSVPASGAGQAPPRPVAPSGARAPRPAGPEAPTEAVLGVAVYPTAQYLGSYDAGRGQRFHLFGVAANFVQVVAYYRTILDQRGDLVFEHPATQMFEVGRYREEAMAFPPGVTVKDYTWGGSDGYPFAKADGTVARYPTVIQIVPVTPEAR